ncbi:hypothetical protein Tco_1428472 [Tanacetum coccineum]
MPLPQILTPIPPPTTKATNPLSTLLDFTFIFQFNNRVLALEKEVSDLKQDELLKTQVTALVDEHLDARLGATRDEFVTFLSVSITAKFTKQVKTQLPQSVQSEELEFEVADSDIPQDQEGNMGKDDEEPIKEVASKPSTDKSLKSFDELMITPIDFSAYIMNGLKIKNLTQETLLGPAFRLLKGTRTNYAELEYNFEECYKALSEKLDLENPEGGNYPFDLTKPLSLVMNGNRQMVPVDYFFNNDLNIKDMVPNIWSTVKVAYDKHALWGILHWREQRKTFYGYVRGLETRHDVYSMKRILAVTRVEVMKKHGYGYLQEIEVRRADNDLYTFKEGDFPRIRINDIEDMLLLVVQNRLTNLSGDVVSDFAITLRMFTRSLVIQKRVEDLQF